MASAAPAAATSKVSTHPKPSEGRAGCNALRTAVASGTGARSDGRSSEGRMIEGAPEGRCSQASDPNARVMRNYLWERDPRVKRRRVLLLGAIAPMDPTWSSYSRLHQLAGISPIHRSPCLSCQQHERKSQPSSRRSRWQRRQPSPPRHARRHPRRQSGLHCCPARTDE